MVQRLVEKCATVKWINIMCTSNMLEVRYFLPIPINSDTVLRKLRILSEAIRGTVEYGRKAITASHRLSFIPFCRIDTGHAWLGSTQVHVCR